jgi:aconitate decarboxylase
MIRAVRLLAAPVPSSDRPRPSTGLEGKFSMQYTVAAAVLDGSVGLSSFTDERLRRADMQALLPKIAVTMSPDITTLYNAGRYVELEIEMADGRTLRSRCDRPRGSWGTEPISTAEHLVKVADCLSTGLDRASVDTCMEMGGRFERLSGAEVRELLRIAGG